MYRVMGQPNSMTMLHRVLQPQCNAAVSATLQAQKSNIGNTRNSDPQQSRGEVAALHRAPYGFVCRTQQGWQVWISGEQAQP